MIILSIDTATDACSVALEVNGEQLIDHRMAAQQHAQLLLPMIDSLFTQAALTPAALDAVVFGRGPGSFTGLRIAAAAAQGIALGNDIGVVAVSTLQMLAQGVARTRRGVQVQDELSARGNQPLHHTVSAQENTQLQDEQSTQNLRVQAALDARMGEVYYGNFSKGADGLMQALGEESVCTPADVAIPENWHDAKGLIAGSGAGLVMLAMQQQTLPGTHLAVEEAHWPHACDAFDLARGQIERGDLIAPEHARPVYLRDQVAQTEAQRAVARE